MKKLTILHDTKTVEIAPVLTGGDLLHLDGQCFEGNAGLLGVALTPPALGHLKRTAAPSHWLIPVERPELAAVAVELPGDVLWLCSQAPSRVIGQLISDLRGAWIEGDSVVISLDGMPRRLRMAQPPHPAFAHAYLARLVSNLWMQLTPAIQIVPQIKTNPAATELIAA